MMPRAIVFGAFDRHNLGDLLFAHVAAAMLPSLLPGCAIDFAGLAARDLRAFGGHRVRPLAELVADRAGGRGRIDLLVHAGGEILTCDAWQAAVMLLDPAEAGPMVSRLDRRPAERLAWAQHRLAGATGDALGPAADPDTDPARRTATHAPYVAGRDRFGVVDRIVHLGVGGVGLERCDPVLRREVLSKLASANRLCVRDRLTAAALADAGIDSILVPDPAILVAQLFGDRITRCAGALPRPPGRYLAFQCSAAFGDDATLARIAAELDAIAATTALEPVLFRAGAAPWHDDLEVLRRIAARCERARPTVFESLDVWETCALLANAAVYAGSSLHGRIVATGFARPRLTIRHPGARAPDKHDAFARSWEAAGLPGSVAVEGIAAGVREALAADAGVLARTARELARKCRRGLTAPA